METVLLEDFVEDGIIKEKSFREKIENMDSLDSVHRLKDIIY